MVICKQQNEKKERLIELFNTSAEKARKAKVPVTISHEFDKHDANNSTRLISFLVDGKPIDYVSAKVIWYKDKTFPPIDDTIMMFIEDTKKKAKAIEDIRKATSIENHPIGKEEK